MDLLSGLRKGDSSRGGRAEFKWEDVKEDKDRENYLGHSLMAPVGRWQKNRDLTWYAKSGAGEMSAEEARKEEIRKIKEAEQDALSEALGFKVVRRPVDPVDQDEVKRAIKMSGDDNEEGKGVGFGKRTGKNVLRGTSGGRGEGDGVKGEFKPALKERRRERSDRWERSRSRGRDDRDRHRYRDRDRGGARQRRQRSRTRTIDQATGVMQLSYPPAQMRQTVAGIEDKTMHDVHSPGQIERILLEENGTGPEKPPNGNSFKNITVLRGGSELGTLFFLRAQFFLVYLPPIEGAGLSTEGKKAATPRSRKAPESTRLTRSTKSKSPLNVTHPSNEHVDNKGPEEAKEEVKKPIIRNGSPAIECSENNRRPLLSKTVESVSPVGETHPGDEHKIKKGPEEKKAPATKKRRAMRKR
ncbi:hypothetical protein C7212DRAFT_172285 [Tuber magnatum]|uniref:Multiple myeloma tumor-associated protein 2-like N-terminal domain-containing protein n=1 Tax=Tuber magnatum TaxID=42249 RepID=A0A317T4R8_9PEZI|nr:hypothetical protein C7212DRAFT_172285 [Tuber magnatum]